MPRRIRCVTLDGYGTLLDRERGLREALLAVPALGRSGNLAGRIVRRCEEIEHGLIVSAPDMPDADTPEERYESLPYRPYSEILAESLILAARDLGCPLTAENAVAAAGSMPRWPLFPDIERALARIRERFPIGLLANAEEDVLEEAISRIGVPFDLVVSAEKVGSYKPSPDHWYAAMHELEADEDEIFHLAASPFHDLETATLLGIPCGFVNRWGRPLTPDAEPLFMVPDLSAAADRLIRYAPSAGVRVAAAPRPRAGAKSPGARRPTEPARRKGAPAPGEGRRPSHSGSKTRPRRGR